MRDIVMNVMVRLDTDDAERLARAQLPGESRNATMLRLLKQGTGTDPHVLLWYRKAPHFPTWMSAGPYPVLLADERARAYALRGFQVDLRNPADPPPNP